MSYPEIQALLDRLTDENAPRPNFEPAITREAADKALHAIAGIYQSRPIDASVIYAYDALYRALGIDWGASNIVFLPPDAE
jgi:hypothetical protein